MDVLIAGRALTKWADVGLEASDVVIASERLEEHGEISGRKFTHSTFANVSFLDTDVVNSEFLDCTFIQCYFRDTRFEGSSFVGCKFIDSNFHKAKVSTCNFRYATFRRSVIPYSELQFSGPPEPNLRHELFTELSRAALEVGDDDNARRYRLGAIEAQNVHLWAAVKHDSDWYAGHFPWDRRTAAGLQLGWHFINRILWRHGESTVRLLAVALVVSVAVFPALFAIRPPAGASPGDLVWLSLSNVLSMDRLSTVAVATGYVRVLSAVEGLIGIAFAGLIVTLILKALLRR